MGHTGARATLVDTRGTFDVRRLASVLRRRIDEELRGRNRSTAQRSNVEVEVNARVKECLSRVDICRVLDFVGAVEVIGEVGRGLEAAKAEFIRRESSMDEDLVEATPMIGDSEDEEDLGFDTSPDLAAINPPKPAPMSWENPQSHGHTALIVIDNVTNIVSDLFNNSSQASGIFPRLWSGLISH
jgi:hypothetical protein